MSPHYLMPINLKPLNDLLLRRFGSNPYGGPNWRIVWSEERREFLAGDMQRKYGDDCNRYVLEKWLPPEHYGDPETWRFHVTDEGLPILGPFPRHGDYEESLRFEANEEAITPTEELVMLQAKLVELGRLHSKTSRRLSLQAAQEKRAKELKERQHAVIDEVIGPYGGQAVSGNPGKKTYEDMRLDMPLSKLPDSIPVAPDYAIAKAKLPQKQGGKQL